VLPDGRIATAGQSGTGANNSRMLLGRLRASGSADPGFNGGDLVTTPFATGLAWLVRDDGQVDLEGRLPGPPGLAPPGTLPPHARIARFTAGGTLDATFGDGGVADAGALQVSTLLAQPGGGLLAFGYPNDPDLYAGPTVAAVRLSAHGQVDPSLGGPSGVRKTLHFGGGIHGGPLRQNSLHIFARALRRPDGSILVPGGVAVVRYTGEGEGYSTGAGAFTSLTPQFGLDTSFGGARTAPRLSVRVPRQSSASVNRRRRVSVVVEPSAPSLCEIRVTAGRRLVAKRVIAMFSQRSRRWSLRTKWSLPTRTRLKVVVRVRDMIATQATATRRSTLR
jgi:hypothetical protein